MAINPPSDIVLGSMLAADPDKYRAAVEKLRNLTANAAARAAEPPPPSAADRTLPAADRSPAARPVSWTPPAPAMPRARSAGDAFGQLEAYVLQTFIQSMLPSNAETVFGKGTAGEVWKSMLAEKLAGEMAKSGQVGLAGRLAEGMAGARGHAMADTDARAQSGGMPRAAPPVLSALSFLQPGAARVPELDDTMAAESLPSEQRS